MKTDSRLLIVPNFIVLLRQLGTGNKSITELFKITEITRANITLIKKMFIKKEWVTINYIRPYKFLCLTDKGKEILQPMNAFLTSIGVNDENIKNYQQMSKHKKQVIVNLEEIVGDEIISKVVEETEKFDKQCEEFHEEWDGIKEETKSEGKKEEIKNE